jgi:hypothetical protein
MGMACSTHVEMRNAYRILVEKSQEKRQLGRLEHRWEDNINMDLREIGRGGMTGFIWLRIANSRGLLRAK